MLHTRVQSEYEVGEFDQGDVYPRRLSAGPELAWTCCDYADMLRERDAEGDRSRAISLLAGC